MRARFPFVTDEAMAEKTKRVFQYMELSIKLGQMEPKVPYCRYPFDTPFVEPVPCGHKHDDGSSAFEQIPHDILYQCYNCGFTTLNPRALTCKHTLVHETWDSVTRTTTRQCGDCNKVWAQKADSLGYWHEVKP
jgi:hypothetical protein